MPTFIWEGRNQQGLVQKGELEAANENAVRDLLRKQNIRPTQIKQKPKDIFANIKLFQPGVKTRDLILFTRQFSTMISAGLPLIQGLEILTNQTENPTFKKVLMQVKSDVEGGSSFADALKKHPKVFDNLYTNLVAAGELGGVLDTILQRLAAYIEKNARLVSKVKGAMVYPSVIGIIAIAVVIVMLVFVIPVFAEMFSSFGGELPGLTQAVVNISNFMRSNWWIILGVVVAVGVAFKKFKSTDRGEYLVDKMMLKMPVIGDLLRKVAVAKFSRTLGTMISSGVPILDGLDIVAKTAGNRIVEDAIMTTRASISEGKSISEPMMQSGVFPPMVCQMVAVGESTGALDAMLAKIADFYEEEVDQAVETLTTLIEPMMMVFLGSTVGTMLAAMYLPIFKIAGAVEGAGGGGAP
ncbi:MAG: type II secretion system F family protein [Desulfobacterota bacterium]|nr:type II secretion system F family protein [Thermodesulfobacteriota bacterium]